MNNKFDELAKALAQSTTRRQALKKFGVGLAGMALASFGFAIRAEAAGSKNQDLCCVYVEVTGGAICAYGCAPLAQGCPPPPDGCQLYSQKQVSSCYHCVKGG